MVLSPTTIASPALTGFMEHTLCATCGDDMEAVAVEWSPETGTVYEPAQCLACRADVEEAGLRRVFV
jgi:hypothetical protein